MAAFALTGMLCGGASPDGQTPRKTTDAERSLQFVKKQLFVNPYESATVADLNRDGHLDIVYGAYWFAGPDFVPRTFRPNHASKDYLRANSDHVLDVDNDGWPDVIAVRSTAVLTAERDVGPVGVLQPGL